jgi:mycothiol synthase
MENKRLRSPRQEDAREVFDLVISCDIEDFGSPDFDYQELLDMWSGFDMENNVWVVEKEDGQLVGYAFLEEDSEEKLFSYGFVLPSARGTGVGKMLLDAIEQRAQALAYTSERKKRLQNLIPTLREDAWLLLKDHGYLPIRYFKRMRIHMEEAPASPVMPEGITITAFVPNRDERIVYDTYVEAFRDHWDFAEPIYETWLEKLKLSSFQPEWWFVARDGEGNVAGIVFSRMSEDTLFVNQIGVRRPYRGRGIGLAMLRHALSASYMAGQPVVSLGVDSDNLTGAYRLYEKVGMKVIHEVTLCEKGIPFSK